jgi:hypothetical protein
MSAFGFRSGTDEASAVPVERLEAEPVSAEHADLMERVLQETLSATAQGQPLAESDMAALLEVARRHRGAALTLEPVAVDLVQALLRVRFATVAAADGLRLAAARRIAATLLEDPPSHDRLLVFWGRLSEAVR